MEMTYRTDGSVYTRRANDTTRYYLHNLLVEDDKIRSYQFPNGRVTFPAATEEDPDPRPRFQYTLKDHLGNTVVLFEDRDGDGFINSSLADPATAEVLQRELYYPFGLPLRGTTPLWPNPSQDYLYNGKEDVWESGLLDYGFRQYSPEVGRFMGVDPLADMYGSVSPYNYVLNNPLLFTDPDGRSVDTDYEINSQGKITVVAGTETDSGPDRLIRGTAKYKNGKLKNKKFMEVNKGVLDDIRSNEHSQVFDMESGDAAENLYDFIATSIDVEMGKYDIKTGDGNKVSIFHTSYDWEKIKGNSEYLEALKERDPGMELISIIHNHDNPPPSVGTLGSINPSGRQQGARTGDVPQAAALNDVFSEQKNKPTYFIWRFGTRKQYDENTRD